MIKFYSAYFGILWICGTRNREFESVSDLTSELSFFIKRFTLAKKKQKEDEKSLWETEKTRNFAETPEEFSEEVIDGLFKDLEHEKSRAPIYRTAAL